MSEFRATVDAVDLFCGAGGLTKGLETASIKVRAGFDVDPTCRYPYEANTSALFQLRDVGELTVDDLLPLWGGAGIRLLAGCAPCQPFSTYGRRYRSRSANADWQLVASFGRLVSDAQPEIVTMENVPEVVRHPVFAQFLDALGGYHVSWKVHECSFFGVPQSRKRLVLLASRLFADPEFAVAESPSAMTVREAIGSLPPLMAGHSDPGDSLHTAANLGPLNLRRIQASTPGGSWRDWPDELRAACHTRNSGSTYPSVYGRMEWDRPGPTITTQCFGYGNGRFGHPEQDRAISLREAALLQTFPPDYSFVPPGASFSFVGVGRLIGNAVPVRIGEAIGAAVMSHAARYVDARLVTGPDERAAVPKAESVRTKLRTSALASRDSAGHQRSLRVAHDPSRRAGRGLQRTLGDPPG